MTGSCCKFLLGDDHVAEISLFLAFGAGLLSFISPCSLPLYPAFLSYITGVSVNDLKTGKGVMRRNALIHTILFLIGFSIIFLALGLSTSFIGSFFLENQALLRQLGAILMVFFILLICVSRQFCRVNHSIQIFLQAEPVFVGMAS